MSNYLKQLDRFLSVVCEHTKHPERNTKLTATVNDLEVYNKLIRDGYINRLNGFNNNLPYSATIEGLIFNEQGGYIQQEKDKQLLREKLENDNKKAKLDSTITSVGSVIAALGAVALIIWEVIKVTLLIKN